MDHYALLNLVLNLVRARTWARAVFTMTFITKQFSPIFTHFFTHDIHVSLCISGYSHGYSLEAVDLQLQVLKGHDMHDDMHDVVLMVSCLIRVETVPGSQIRTELQICD